MKSKQNKWVNAAIPALLLHVLSGGFGGFRPGDSLWRRCPPSGRQRIYGGADHGAAGGPPAQAAAPAPKIPSLQLTAPGSSRFSGTRRKVGLPFRTEQSPPMPPATSAGPPRRSPRSITPLSSRCFQTIRRTFSQGAAGPRRAVPGGAVLFKDGRADQNRGKTFPSVLKIFCRILLTKNGRGATMYLVILLRQTVILLGDLLAFGLAPPADHEPVILHAVQDGVQRGCTRGSCSF